MPIFYVSFLILIPLALVDGAMFAFGCQVFAKNGVTRQRDPR